MTRESSHPLDLIPFFRRWESSTGRDLVYTGIWNTLLALFLVVFGRLFNDRGGAFWDDFYPTLVMSNVIGYLIHATMMGATRLLHGWPTRARGSSPRPAGPPAEPDWPRLRSC